MIGLRRNLHDGVLTPLSVKQGVVIGVSVAATVLVILFGIFAFMCFRRRRINSRARYNRRPEPSYVIEDVESVKSRPPNPIPIYTYPVANPFPVSDSHQDSSVSSDFSLPTPPFEKPRQPPSIPAKWEANNPGLLVKVSSSRVLTVDQLKEAEILPLSRVSQRMQVKGRAQDGGVRLVVTNGWRESAQSKATRTSVGSILPPDYGQAVEPLRVRTDRTETPPSAYMGLRRV